MGRLTGFVSSTPDADHLDIARLLLLRDYRVVWNDSDLIVPVVRRIVDNYMNFF